MGTSEAGERCEGVQGAAGGRAYEPAPSAGKLLLFVLVFAGFAVVVVGGGVLLVAGG